MHWRHVSITTTPCWGSRLVALRAHVLLAERIGAHPLSQCAHPGQLGGEACRGLPSECMLGDGARGVPRLTPNTTGIRPSVTSYAYGQLQLNLNHRYTMRSFMFDILQGDMTRSKVILTFTCLKMYIARSGDTSGSRITLFFTVAESVLPW